ncbi:MAG: ORF6N domain-containing protein [Cyclobacteriaceae bacterium]|nr:ORF6N domain-containing protein [Cyclobacteriaceae bacterium]
MQLQAIQNRIYDVRGLKVMLDFDLAELYEVENRALKQAVKRNIDRFPNDFLFQLTKKEWQELITNCDKLPEGVKFSPATPFAFTEQGVSMLSSILKSKKAIQVNIAVMRAFVFIRQYALSHKELSDKLKELETRYNKQFKDVGEALNYLLQKDKEVETFKKRRRIGFKSGGK